MRGVDRNSHPSLQMQSLLCQRWERFNSDYSLSFSLSHIHTQYLPLSLSFPLSLSLFSLSYTLSLLLFLTVFILFQLLSVSQFFSHFINLQLCLCLPLLICLSRLISNYLLPLSPLSMFFSSKYVTEGIDFVWGFVYLH